MPSVLAQNSKAANASNEKSGGQQFQSQQSTAGMMPRPRKPAERILHWEPSNLDDVTFMRLPEVKAITGLSKSSLYVLIREKSFPAPVRLGSRAVAWVKSEVKQWAADRVHASRPAV